MINEGADLEKDRLPVGQMTGDGGMERGGGTEWRGGQGYRSTHSGKWLLNADTYNSSHLLTVSFISLQCID